MEGSWIALLPFLLVIPVSIITKQVQPGLFAALVLGSYLKEPSILGGIKTLISYLVDNIVKTNNIKIIIFLYVFAGLISIIKLAGGIKGFVHLVSKKVKTEKSAMFLTWFSTLGTFSDPDFRIVTIAPIMKALKKRLNMSSQKIGFVIEATSNPVVALIPVATAFVGYMVSLIATSLQHAGIHKQAYTVYVQSIPFNFFSFVMIGVGIYYSFFKHDKTQTGEENVESVNTSNTNGNSNTQNNTNTKSNMDTDVNVSQMFKYSTDQDKVTQQDKAVKKEPNNPNAEQGEEDLEECYRAFEKDTPSRPWNLILPLIMVLTLTLFLSWWDGHTKAKGFFDAFLKVDALGVMLEALFITFILTMIFFLFQHISIAKLVTHFVKGGNELMSVIIMLALIWGVSAVSEDLGFSKFITAHVKGFIPHTFVAPVLFLLGGLISYFIGSSWGTWGLLMPLGITLAHQTGSNILLVIGAVFASGTFGAFASPLSDNTVTLCTILGLPVIDYAKTKLVPSLIAAGITTVLFGIASFIIR